MTQHYLFQKNVHFAPNWNDIVQTSLPYQGNSFTDSNPQVQKVYDRWTAEQKREIEKKQIEEYEKDIETITEAIKVIDLNATEMQICRGFINKAARLEYRISEIRNTNYYLNNDNKSFRALIWYLSAFTDMIQSMANQGVPWDWHLENPEHIEVLYKNCVKIKEALYGFFGLQMFQIQEIIFCHQHIYGDNGTFHLHNHDLELVETGDEIEVKLNFIPSDGLQELTEQMVEEQVKDIKDYKPYSQLGAIVSKWNDKNARIIN